MSEIDDRNAQQAIWDAERKARFEAFEAERKARFAKVVEEYGAAEAARKLTATIQPTADTYETLDNVGLNIAGMKPEPQPELAPLTDDDKAMLETVAASGASLQAMAEIEQQLRAKTATPAQPTNGYWQQQDWRVKNANQYAATLPTKTQKQAEIARTALEEYIERCKREVTDCATLASWVPSALLVNARTVGMKAFAIMDMPGYPTDEQITALTALLGEI